MTLAGLTLPFVSKPDPDTMREGSLDPLGLAGIADHLADELAPEVTARMSRIRFLTAIAAGSAVTGEPEEWMAVDGTPAYLPFEWLVVEAFVRQPPEGGTSAVPGIRKAREQLRRPGRHLDARSYLKTPKVFGFYGVYKRLARDLAIVDGALVVLDRGEELISAWERREGLEGFLAQRDGSPGGRLARVVRREVETALELGHVKLGPTSQFWELLSAGFAPSLAGTNEQRLLWDWLRSHEHPVRRSYVDAISALPTFEATERVSLDHIRRTTKDEELRLRLQAVDAYEALVLSLTDAFSYLRVVATNARPSAVKLAAIARADHIKDCALKAPAALAVAAEALSPLGLGVALEEELGTFGDPLAPAGFLATLLDRHDQVQERKDTRPWFERDGDEILVRGIGTSPGPFEPRQEYVHPYRARAISSFVSDLARGGVQ